jgi:glucose/mannose-6-phosphate isomerase
MMKLDDPETYKKYDPSGMLARIREMPEQCRRAWQDTINFDLPRGYSGFERVVVLGMGGSAIGGDFVQTLAECENKVLLVHRDYGLPPSTDATSLIVASSYSGNTEETISALIESLKTPSKKLVITSGGRLQSLAEENGIPVLSLNYQSQPRAALGYSFILLLGLVHKVGFISDKSRQVDEMVRVLEELSACIDEKVPSSVNPAKQMASKLYGRLTVIYGGGILSPVARRWKTQLNENSKAWAFYEIFPEVNHNGVVGYEFPQEMKHETFVVFLRAGALPPPILSRYELTAELLDRAGVTHEFVEARGEDTLSQMMSLTLFGDYVSYYLAMLYRVDPSPVKAIDYLKKGITNLGK